MANWIEPFKDEADQEYHYFSVGQITKKYKIKQSTYDKGLELVRSKNAYIENMRLGYNTWSPDNGLICSLRIIIKDKCYITVLFEKENMLEFRCPVHSCYNKYNRGQNEICEHEAAALILMRDYLAEHRPGDSTDYNAEMFLSQFRSSQQSGNGRNKTVHLIPRLCHDGENLRLRLLISTDSVKKSYVVKDMTNLLQAVVEHRTYQLGKSNHADFAHEGFADESYEFMQSLKGWILDKQYQNSNKWYGYYSDDDLKAYVRLYGDRLDRFYELFENRDVEYDISKNARLHLKACNPRIHLKIKKLADKNGQFEGVTVSGKFPDVFPGNQYAYCIANGCLCRMDKEYSREMMPLLSLDQSNDGKIHFRIGRKNLAEFYYTILPILRKTAVIEEIDGDEIDNFLPPEVSFKFYLDVDNGRPECRIGTWYGDVGVAVFDLLESPILKEDFRDAQRERYVLDTVQRYFPEFSKSEERFLSDDNEDAIYEILENAVPKLMELGETVCTDRFQGIQVRRKLNISVGVSIESDLLNLEIATENLSQRELLDIIKSYKQRKKYHRLKSGEFVDIDDSIAELSAMLDTMHISPKEFVRGKMQIPSYRALYLDKMLAQSQEIYAKRDSHYKQLIKSFKTVTESDFDIPESLQGIMRSYQQFGHKWLRTLGGCGFGGILADDMGLGKTLQMISVLLAEKRENGSGTSLIVCPASLVFNWSAEFEKFAPDMKYCTIAGPQKERGELIGSYKDYDVLITSYDLIKRDIANYEDCRFTYQVLDEAQYIKNHNTAAARSVKLINAKWKFALTGTPIENRLSELWSIFDYLMPGFLYGYETFKKEFETPIVRRSDEEASRRLRRMTSPFILRRLKQDVLRDLPDKLEENYIVRLDDRQRHVYDAKVLELRQMLDKTSADDYQTDKLRILAFLTQIRQICCDPALLFSDYPGESAKKTACMEIVQRAIEGEHRVLIFSQFTTMLERLETELTSQGISYYKIIGETSKKKRMELVDKFNSGNTPVFLISLKAGGTGLNLTGADVVVHYDPWWNVAAQNQATDRAHRIGQTRAVTVYKLIAKDTIEEKIQLMQEKKQNLADSVLTGDFVNLSSLSKDELMSILG